jgi:Ty3 transposon capsid-like protein/Zinc knuckle
VRERVQRALTPGEERESKSLTRTISSPLSLSVCNDVSDLNIVAEKFPMVYRMLEDTNDKLMKLTRRYEENLQAQSAKVSLGHVPKIKSPPTWENSQKSGDIVVWLEKVGAYVNTNNSLPESSKVYIAVSFLVGEASEFWMHVRPDLEEKLGREITFVDFSEKFKEQFSESFRQENAAEQLCSLKEVKGKHDEYRLAFDRLLAKLPSDLAERNECWMVAQYRKGLHRSTAARALTDVTTCKKHKRLRDFQDAAKLGAEAVAAELKDDLEQLQGKPPVGRPEIPKNYPVKRKNVEASHPKRKQPKLDGSCHLCGKLGHFKKDCPAKQGGTTAPSGGYSKGRSGKGRPRR